MEIIIKDLSFGRYLENVNCHFKSGTITGITGDSGLYLLDLLNGDISRTAGRVVINKNEIDEDYYKENPATIVYLSEYHSFYSKKVIDEFKFTINYRAYKNDMIKTKINNILVLVGLNESYLQRDIETLSTSEKIFLSLALCLVCDPKVVILGDVFKFLDKDKRKRLMSIMNNLKQSNKIVIFFSRDANNVYDYSDFTLIFVANSSEKFGPTNKVYTNNSVLKDKKISIPSLPKITYLANKKKVNLSFHKDVRDIIKDVYKHV